MYETKNIASDVEIKEEIIHHKEKLFEKRNSILKLDDNFDTIFYQQTSGPKIIQDYRDKKKKEIFKLYLKEKCLKLFLDGEANLIENLNFSLTKSLKSKNIYHF